MIKYSNFSTTLRKFFNYGHRNKNKLENIKCMKRSNQRFSVFCKSSRHFHAHSNYTLLLKSSQRIAFYIENFAYKGVSTRTH